MSWTTLIAEYLVVGCLAVVWIVLMALFVGGASPDAALGWVRALPAQLGPTLAVAFLAAAYTLGTLADHLCYLLTVPYLRWYNRRQWNSYHCRGLGAVGTKFFAAEDRLLGFDGQRDRLIRRRGRIRILRAVFLQTPLLATGVWLHVRSPWPLLAFGVAWLLTGVVLHFVFRQYLQMIARSARRPPDHT